MTPAAEHEDTDRSRRRFLQAGGFGAAAAGAGLVGGALAPGGGRPAEAFPGTVATRLLTDFGAVGDGEVDDTAAVQAAFDQLGSPPDRAVAGVQGGHLQVPPGEYRLTATISVHRFAGIIEGTGSGHTPAYPAPRAAGRGTAFTWDGPAGEPMFRITDSSHLRIRDLRFSGNDDAPPSAALNFHKEVGHQAGTNGHLTVEDCVFGIWPWSTSGTNTGLVGTAIAFTNGPDAGDNDQFRVARCLFRGPRNPPPGTIETAGITLAGTQSVWGSITDCTFDALTVGFRTVASSTLVNPQFNSCGTDLVIQSTAAVTVVAWQSEHSRCLAEVGPSAALHATGGVCMVRRDLFADGRPLIDAFPSGSGQTVSLRDIRFLSMGSAQGSSTRPPIRFGPSEEQSISSGGMGFVVRVDNCTGLHPEQCRLEGELYAAVPRSRGLVEWHSRSSDGVSQFRNELWRGGPEGTRTTIDTGAWDPPRAGLHD